jgi:acetyl esterase/lipase
MGVACVVGALIDRRLRSGRPMLRFLTRALGVLSTLLLAAIAVAWWYSRPPRPDAFYDRPASVPPSPGALLRHEAFTRVVPNGARVWRILYTTTRDGDVAAVASAIVLAPAILPDGPRPVIAWTHGTTGVMPGCAPSVLPPPFPFDATVPALEHVIAQGWILVATDYVGLGTAGVHPYLIGENEARSALDAIRAARHLTGLALDDRIVVWGHSQGGHAALWTGGLAPRYAPDVTVIGVAALAPATLLPALVDAAQYSPVGKIMGSFIVTAYSDAYSDVVFDEYVRSGARLLARDMASRCLAAPGALFSVVEATRLETSIFGRAVTSGPLAERLERNVPRLPIAAPVLIAQGNADDLVLPAIQERFVKERCSAGQRLEYRTYEGRDHVGLVARESALIGDLVRWTKDRLAGAPSPPGCSTVRR